MMEIEGLLSLPFCVPVPFSDHSPTPTLLTKETKLYNTQASNLVAAMSLWKTLQCHNTNVFILFVYFKHFNPLVLMF